MDIQHTHFNTSDGHQLSACLCDSGSDAKAVLIIIQEIFGLTEHLCSLTQRFAENGYTSVAPALFDRVTKNTVLPYSASGAERGKSLVAKLDYRQVLNDIQAVVDHYAMDHKVAIVGYCWGGSIAYLSASQLNLDAGIAYYGTRIHQMLEDNTPNCPFMFHFGEQDELVPIPNIKKIEAANPESPLHLYPNAGHAFSCEPRPGYHPISAEIAMDRSLAFLQQQLG
jgi:carboxymethylenebutenolidase